MVYLDNAATTFLKPRTVRQAVVDALHTCASAGRGGYAGAVHAESTVYSARTALAALYGVRPENVSFTYNATSALNMAIKGLAGSGNIVLSGYEHNAVARPVYALRGASGFTVAESPLFDPDAMLHALRDSIRPGTSLAVLCHVSNVFGFVAPLEEIDALCWEKGVPLVVDCAQSAGLLVPDVRALEKLPGVRVYRAQDESAQTGVFSFTVDGRECEDAARALASAGIAVRAGLHCAPLAHRTAGTFPGGTVRVSPGAFTTAQDMEKLVRAVSALVRSGKAR